MEKVYKKGQFLGTVDRTFENRELEPEIVVTLPFGFSKKFKNSEPNNEWFIKQTVLAKEKQLKSKA